MIRTSSERAIYAWCLAIGLASSTVTTPRRSDADASASAVVSAKSLVVDGRALRDAGDHRGARDKFRAAYAMVPTPIIGVDLGKEHLALGELVEAREVFVEVTRLPPSAKDSAEGKAARAEAASLASSLAARIASLEIELTGTPEGVVLTLSLDDESTPVAVPRKVNPGPHVVVVKLADKQKRVEVTLAEGETKQLTINVEDLTPAKAVPVAPVARDTPAAAPAGPSALTYGALGLGGVGLVVGGITGVMALTRASDVKSNCVDFQCPPSTHGDYDASRTLGTISTISFAVGALGVGVGLFGLLSSGKPDKTTASVDAWIGVGRIGVQGVF